MNVPGDLQELTCFALPLISSKGEWLSVLRKHGQLLYKLCTQVPQQYSVICSGKDFIFLASGLYLLSFSPRLCTPFFPNFSIFFKSNFSTTFAIDPVDIPKGERFSWNEITSNEIKKRNPELNSSRFEYHAYQNQFSSIMILFAIFSSK